MTIQEKEVIDKIRKKYNTTKDNFIYEKYESIRLDISFVKDFEILLNYIDKLEKENENAIWYVNQMIIRLHEDIIDYIDDDKIRNQAIIGELKETKQEWLDVKKLLNGESIDNLYNDWRKYGEYE